MYQVNCCQGGDCWDFSTRNSFKDGFGSYYSVLVMLSRSLLFRSSS
jgi:hypothetical protein